MRVPWVEDSRTNFCETLVILSNEYKDFKVKEIYNRQPYISLVNDVTFSQKICIFHLNVGKHLIGIFVICRLINRTSSALTKRKLQCAKLPFLFIDQKRVIHKSHKRHTLEKLSVRNVLRKYYYNVCVRRMSVHINILVRVTLEAHFYTPTKTFPASAKWTLNVQPKAHSNEDLIWIARSFLRWKFIDGRKKRLIRHLYRDAQFHW